MRRSPSNPWSGTIARNIARIARNTRNTRCTGIYWNISNATGLLVMLARLLVMLSVILRPLFTDFSDFLGRLHTTSHVAVRMTTCFFFRIRPPGGLDNKRSSARRGEFDSSTPEAIGGLLG